MGLVKIQRVECDSVPECDEKLEMSPSISQPFQAIVSLGWSTETDRDGIRTYCPMHTRQRGQSDGS